uniref:(northern house mosquito) hypothetical protein n=1 Tax=Culex pipiens TaxID=7175 RepID=A0A8D8P2H2_CULPI
MTLVPQDQLHDRFRQGGAFSFGQLEANRSRVVKVLRGPAGPNVQPMAVVGLAVAGSNRPLGVLLRGKVNQHVQQHRRSLELLKVQAIFRFSHEDHPGQQAFRSEKVRNLLVPGLLRKIVEPKVGHVNGPVARQWPLRKAFWIRDCRVEIGFGVGWGRA